MSGCPVREAVAPPRTNPKRNASLKHLMVQGMKWDVKESDNQDS